MDPNATLRLINDADADTVDSFYYDCLALHDWIKRGGFAPEWGRYMKGTERYCIWFMEDVPAIYRPFTDR